MMRGQALGAGERVFPAGRADCFSCERGSIQHPVGLLGRSEPGGFPVDIFRLRQIFPSCCASLRAAWETGNKSGIIWNVVEKLFDRFQRLRLRAQSRPATARFLRRCGFPAVGWDYTGEPFPVRLKRIAESASPE